MTDERFNTLYKLYEEDELTENQQLEVLMALKESRELTDKAMESLKQVLQLSSSLLNGDIPEAMRPHFKGLLDVLIAEFPND